MKSHDGYPAAENRTERAPMHHARASEPASNVVSNCRPCELCLGDGRVPAFEDRDGLRMPVGYKPCDCAAQGRGSAA
jgi:hypothetical protein